MVRRIRICVSTIFIFAMGTNCFGQSDNLPLKSWSGNPEREFVFYISGDGGLNKFSTDFSAAINKKGYSVATLNARSYFWSRKTPQQAAGDIESFLMDKLKHNPGQHFVLIGYSFGADVMPFIVNNLSSQLKNKIKSVILISPSTTTDFQIHILDMIGRGGKRSMNVVAAINRMQSPRTLTIFGSDEKDFPIKSLTLQNNKVELLPGGHHFEGNTDEVAEMVTKNF